MQIQEDFKLKSVSHGCKLKLFMEGFALLPDTPISVLHDRDAVTVGFQSAGAADATEVTPPPSNSSL